MAYAASLLHNSHAQTNKTQRFEDNKEFGDSEGEGWSTKMYLKSEYMTNIEHHCGENCTCPLFNKKFA
jgi:hypothetical protein